MAYGNGGNYTISNAYVAANYNYPAYIYDTRVMPPEAGTSVPASAHYIQASYADFCAICGRTTAAGEYIWWNAKTRRVYCSTHKSPPAADPAVGATTHKEQDMAQRQHFTFPYTGTEIAAGLEAKAAKLDADAAAGNTLDPATLAVLYPNKLDRESIVTSQQNKAEKLAKNAASLRTEARPYAKAGDQKFDLDLEDVEHFGLDSEATVAAAPKRRLRKESAPKPVEEASTSE